MKRHLDNDTVLLSNCLFAVSCGVIIELYPTYVYYLQELRRCVMEPLHGVAEVIGVAEVKVRCIQDWLHHLQIQGVTLHLLLGQVERGPSIGYHLGWGYSVNLMTRYSATHLSIHNDNEVTTGQKAYSSNQSPYLPTTGSCWNLTSCASWDKNANLSLTHLINKKVHQNIRSVLSWTRLHFLPLK